jgi:hypothetical protein
MGDPDGRRSDEHRAAVEAQRAPQSIWPGSSSEKLPGHGVLSAASSLRRQPADQLAGSGRQGLTEPCQRSSVMACMRRAPTADDQDLMIAATGSVQ